MQLGLFQMPFHMPYRPLIESWQRDLDLIILADKLGYHEAWIGEHTTLPWENVPCPELLISQALVLTKNIKLGTGVSQLPIHHPVDLAHRIAMLDHMAQGRFYWGIGVRSMPSDLEIFGVDTSDMNKVRDRGQECLEAILGIWGSDEDTPFEFKGKYYDIKSPENYRSQGAKIWLKPFQTPHPPIGVASNSPGSETLSIAGKKGWMPMSGSTMLPKDIQPQWNVIENGAESANRNANRSDWRIAKHVYVSDTSENARREVLEVFGKVYNYLNQFKEEAKKSDLAPAVDRESKDSNGSSLEKMIDDVWIVGDPNECANKIRDLYNLVGGFGHLLTVTYDPDDHNLQKNSLELLAKEVLPKLSDLKLN